jgi:hypothetical protein
MRTITIGWGTVTRQRSRFTGRSTTIAAYGNNAPEIEADALLRTADRFAPDAVLEVKPVYTITSLGEYGDTLAQEEAETRLPGVEEPRRYYASVSVREVRQ